MKIVPLYPLNKKIEEGSYSLSDNCTILDMLRDMGLEEKVIAGIRVIGDGGFFEPDHGVEDGMTYVLLPTFAGG